MLKTFFSLICTFLLTLPVLAADETTTTTARKQSSFWQTLIMIAIAIVFFYFILWRPEQKRRKEMEKKRGAMKKGDKITAMGIVGTIDRVKEQTVIVKMVDGKTLIEFLKGAISEVKPKEEVEETPEETKAEDNP